MLSKHSSGILNKWANLLVDGVEKSFIFWSQLDASRGA